MLIKTDQTQNEESRAERIWERGRSTKRQVNEKGHCVSVCGTEPASEEITLGHIRARGKRFWDVWTNTAYLL